MKAKKFLPIIALALAATTLTACGDKSVTFGHYWFTDSLTKVENFYEEATYDVTSESFTNNYVNYKVSFDGTFTTTFEYNHTEGFYEFATKLDVKATYELGDSTTTVDDYAESWVKFDAKGNALRPIESSKKMLCHTPLSGEFKTVEQCYATVDYEYATKYSSDTNKGTIQSTKCNVTNNEGKTTESILNDTFSFVKDHTFIDNEQLLVAIRAFSEDASSATLGSYSAFAKNTQKIKLSFSNAEDNATETFSYNLIDANGNETPKQLNHLCRTAKISLDQENPGVTQTVKFVKAESPSNNTYRNLILEMTTPLSYSMGEIYYKLKSVSYKKP
ncbi:MAG: hypothetical protein IJ308_08390 [Clostridia bacterium]|nr:hypothetical protein [Clostridia bacterium]MBQ7913737.1 hypothetical protein [Clostridia bacterium]